MRMRQRLVSPDSLEPTYTAWIHPLAELRYSSESPGCINASAQLHRVEPIAEPGTIQVFGCRWRLHGFDGPS